MRSERDGNLRSQNGVRLPPGWCVGLRRRDKITRYDWLLDFRYNYLPQECSAQEGPHSLILMSGNKVSQHCRS